MGCFNVACNLTGVSMYSDKALWVPLIYSNPNSKPSYGGNHFIYPTAVFTPIACPVFGNVDSYGRLENIERTPNVEAIEKYFNADIDDIIDEPGKFKVKGIKNGQLSGTFINYDAFEWSKNNLFDDGGSNITNLLDSDMKPEILNICGFNFVSADSKRERYDDLYTSERYPGVEWWSDGTWGNFNDGATAYNPVDFFKVLKTKTGIDPDPEAIVTLQNTWSTLFNLKAEILKMNEDAKMWSGMIAALKDDSKSNFDIVAYNRQKLYSFCQNEGSRDEPPSIFDKMYGHNLDLYVEDLANLAHLSTALFINNRFWSPQANGIQHGSPLQEKATAQWIIDRATVLIKEYQDEIDAENEEDGLDD